MHFSNQQLHSHLRTIIMQFSISPLPRNQILLIALLTNLALAQISTDAGYPRARSLGDELVYKIMKFMKTIPLGNPNRNIPIFDPFVLDNLAVDFDNRLFNVHGSLKNVKVKGLKGLFFNDIVVHTFPPEVVFNLTLPKFKLQIGNYDLSGKIFKFLPLSKEGKLIVTVNGINVDGLLSLTLKNKFVEVLDADINGNFDNFTFCKIIKRKSVCSKKILSKIFSFFVTQIFRRNILNVWKMVSNYVKNFINTVMKNFTVKEVLDFLKNDNDGLLPL